MSEGPQYTSCIDKADWKSAFDSIGVANIAGAVAALLAALAGFPLAGLVLAFAAGAEIMRKVAEWQLHGKLICLSNVLRRDFTDPDPDRICVLGTVLDFESVGEDKSGFENIDNDFGVNLFIAPFAISDLVLTDFDFFRRRMESSPQGDLIQNPDAQPLMGNPEPGPGPLKRKDDPSQNFGPMPADPAPPGFIGYKRVVMLSATFPRPIPANAFFNPLVLAKVDPVFQSIYDAVYADYFIAHPGENPADSSGFVAAFYGEVDATFHFVSRDAPSFHCEFEGSRIRDVYEALDFAHVHCDASGFWGFVCDAVNFIISTLLGLPKLIAAAAAWANADDGALANSYDGAGGEIGVGDSLVLRGRWVYDSAHSGYNEMHAVRTVQKIGPAPQEYGEFIVFHGRWCSELAKVPPNPPRPRDPDAPPDPASGLPFTKPQQQTYDAQQRDENRWVFHPAIDGCIPQTPPPESDPLR